MASSKRRALSGLAPLLAARWAMVAKRVRRSRRMLRKRRLQRASSSQSANDLRIVVTAPVVALSTIAMGHPPKSLRGFLPESARQCDKERPSHLKFPLQFDAAACGANATTAR